MMVVEGGDGDVVGVGTGVMAAAAATTAPPPPPPAAQRQGQQLSVRVPQVLLTV